MKRITLIGIPLIAAALNGCGSSAQEKPDAIRVCKDAKTNQVVEDSRCGSGVVHHSGGGNPFLWWYLGYMQGGYRPGYVVSGGSPIYQGRSSMGFTTNTDAANGGGWTSTGKSFGRSAGFGSTGTAHSSGVGA
jgi:hypothetical protein